MGLGLRIVCKHDDLSGRSREALEHAITQFAKQHPADELFQRWIRVDTQPDRLCVRLYPCEESVEFILSNYGDLICDAKTSTAGPGYHAFLVEWLEQLGKSCELKWTWISADEEFGDETGFHEHRDFARLQAEMLKQLRSLSSVLLEHKTSDHFTLGLPLGFLAPDVSFFAMSWLGFWTRDWFERVAAADDSEIKTLAAEFFPWFNASADAAFWAKTTRGMLWSEVPWHAPFNAAEVEVCELVLECAAKAEILQPGIVQSQIELAELRALLAEKPGSPIAPEKHGAGFRRQLVSRSAGGEWQLCVPGYWYEEFDDDGKSLLFWFGDKTIQTTSFSIQNQDEYPESAAVLLDLENMPPEALQFTHDHLQGCAEIIRKKKNRDGPMFMLSGKVALPNQLLIINICYENEADESWAIEVWRGVKHP